MDGWVGVRGSKGPSRTNTQNEVRGLAALVWRRRRGQADEDQRPGLLVWVGLRRAARAGRAVGGCGCLVPLGQIALRKPGWVGGWVCGYVGVSGLECVVFFCRLEHAAAMVQGRTHAHARGLPPRGLWGVVVVSMPVMAMPQDRTARLFHLVLAAHASSAQKKGQGRKLPEILTVGGWGPLGGIGARAWVYNVRDQEGQDAEGGKGKTPEIPFLKRHMQGTYVRPPLLIGWRATRGAGTARMSTTRGTTTGRERVRSGVMSTHAPPFLFPYIWVP